jgi:hypothetical protein
MTDTSAAAANIQLQILRGLSGERRLALAVEMSLFARSLLLARLRGEHPEWTADQLKLEVLRLTLPGATLPPGLR